MNYYIKLSKKGPATECSRTKYYKVKREALKESGIPSSFIELLIEYKGDKYKLLEIISYENMGNRH